MQLAAVSLDDKYESREGRIHITGSQALVRLAMMQCIRDRTASLDTACYITGYRGSPMHNIDKELWSANRFLSGSNIHFQPAINEDLAATAIWGSQQATEFGDCRHDGIFSMWYGKGPGLDRSMDAIRHGHMAGSSRHGGVLVMVGDDHALTSTDAPAAHEFAFVELMMPFLYPSNVHEVLSYGLHGIALSRFSGAWVGYKAVPDTVDASAPLTADPFDPEIVLPGEFEMPPDGLNLRIPDFWYQMEPRHRNYKLDAAVAYARANRLNRVMVASRRPRYGIVATGKAFNDVRQALFDLGIDDRTADEIGITVLKMAMPYPFDAETVRDFADGLEELFVVEEKVTLTELQARNALYPLPDGRRPRVIGQKDEAGRVLLPGFPEVSPDDVSRALAARIAHFHTSSAVDDRIAFIEAKAAQGRARNVLGIARTPYFCSGCPHNTSTRVPEGSRALGGVGCHFMATYMDRGNVTHTHMGGEGANWMGQAPFVETGHVFQNLGDGTYYHSGLLAIRACVAAGINITYKILFNDAVAMTGGQPHDGPLDPPAISRQVRGEGVETIWLVSDEPEKYGSASRLAPGTRIAHRRELDRIQRELREVPGVSVLIYDQTCAAEKRRRRRRGAMVDPDRPGVHQPPGVRRLRGLQRKVELPLGPPARHRVRAQAPDRPVRLQQGLLLRGGLLSELRDRAGGETAPGRGRGRSPGQPRRPARAGTPAPRGRPRVQHAGRRGGRHRRRDHRGPRHHGRPPGGHRFLDRGSVRDGPEGRRGHEPRADRGASRRHARHPPQPPVRPTSCWAATASSHRAISLST